MELSQALSAIAVNLNLAGLTFLAAVITLLAGYVYLECKYSK